MTARGDAEWTADPARTDALRELRWIKLYTELTGATESEARACWMYVPEAPSAALNFSPCSP